MRRREIEERIEREKERKKEKKKLNYHNLGDGGVFGVFSGERDSNNFSRGLKRKRKGRRKEKEKEKGKGKGRK